MKEFLKLAQRFDADFAEIFNDEYQAKVDEARAEKGFAPKEQAMLLGTPEALIDELTTTNALREGERDT